MRSGSKSAGRLFEGYAWTHRSLALLLALLLAGCTLRPSEVKPIPGQDRDEHDADVGACVIEVDKYVPNSYLLWFLADWVTGGAILETVKDRKFRECIRDKGHPE